MNLQTILSALTVMLTATYASPAAADPAPGGPAADKPKSAAKPAAGSSLDDELFKDLDVGSPTKKPATPPQTKPGSTEPSPQKTAPPAPDAKPAATEKKTDPAPAKPAPKLNPLDEELLKQLEGGDAPKKKPPQSPSAGPGGAGQKSDEPESDNPFIKLSRQVRDAERRLRGSDSGDQTQELQRRIVDDLEKLIAQIEQQQSQRSQSQSSKPGSSKPGEKGQQPKPGQKQSNGQQQPADKPTDSGDQLTQRKNEKPGTGGGLKNLLEKVWGELPERQRQDVMQSSFDDFPVKYQHVIEEYFKTLLKRQD